MIPTYVAWPVGVLIALLSAWAGWFGLGRVFSAGVIRLEDAHGLVKQGRVAAWNALREFYGDWIPDLHGMDLEQAQLTGINLRGANLSNANLQRAVLVDADLSEAQLTDANLTGADLTRAALDYARLTGASLEDTILVGASATGTERDITPVSLSLGQDARLEPRAGLRALIGQMAVDQSALDGVSQRVFEDVVATLLEYFGYRVQRETSVCSGIVDLLIEKKEPLGVVTYVVDCKHYRMDRAVVRPTLMALEAARVATGSARAMLITSGRFSGDATQFAGRVGMQLFDRDALLGWITEYAGSLKAR